MLNLTLLQCVIFEKLWWLTAYVSLRHDNPQFSLTLERLQRYEKCMSKILTMPESRETKEQREKEVSDIALSVLHEIAKRYNGNDMEGQVRMHIDVINTLLCHALDYDVEGNERNNNCPDYTDQIWAEVLEYVADKISTMRTSSQTTLEKIKQQQAPSVKKVSDWGSSIPWEQQ